MATRKDSTTAEAVAEVDVVEHSLRVSGGDGQEEARLSDDSGKVSLVVRGPKSFVRKAIRGGRFVMTLSPDVSETIHNTVTVEIPAEDTGGLPSSAKEVKREDR